MKRVCQSFLLSVVFALLPLIQTEAQTNRSPTGAIRGTVENHKGEPLHKVKVRAISRRTDQLAAEAETDEKGQFTLSPLPEGRYTLDFYSPAYQKATIQAIEVEAGKERKLDRPVRLKPVELYAVIRGAVFNDQGFLLPGARVVLQRVPFQAEPIESLTMDQMTNASGEFAFRLPAVHARYRLTASAKGFKPGSTTVDVGGAERHPVNIRLEREP